MEKSYYTCLFKLLVFISSFAFFFYPCFPEGQPFIKELLNIFYLSSMSVNNHFQQLL